VRESSLRLPMDNFMFLAADIRIPRTWNGIFVDFWLRIDSLI
jgi:hypothetical protein